MSFANKSIEWIAQSFKTFQHPAIVFDIDQTAFLYKIQFCKKDVCTFQKFPQAQRNEEIFKIYSYALEHDIAVFFVTARPTWGRDQTMKDLIRLGFGKMEGLILRPTLPKFTGIAGIALYKQKVRELLSKKGFHILMNFGDKWQDLSGGGADKHVKLPEIPTFYQY